MPQTPPFSGMVPRKLTDTELARAIRLNIEAELDAINLYAAHMDATDNAEAKAVLAHVIDEEREHAELFWELVRRLDPAQDRQHARAPRKYELLIAGAPEEVVEAAGEEEPAKGPLPPRLTVGSLKS